MHIFSTVNKLNVSRETFISFFTVLFVKNMALACAARARGRVARFLDFWRFSAVFCPDMRRDPTTARAPRSDARRPRSDARRPRIMRRAIRPALPVPRSAARENF